MSETPSALSLNQQTSTSTSTRLVYKLKDEIKESSVGEKPKLPITPSAQRVLVILDKPTAIALSRYMGDSDDFRPGKHCGDFIRSGLAKLGYLKVEPAPCAHKWKTAIIRGELMYEDRVFCENCGTKQDEVTPKVIG